MDRRQCLYFAGLSVFIGPGCAQLRSDGGQEAHVSGVQAWRVDDAPTDAGITESTDLPLDDYPEFELLLEEAADPEADHEHMHPIGKPNCDDLEVVSISNDSQTDLRELTAIIDDLPSYNNSDTCEPDGWYVTYAGQVSALTYEESLE